MDLLRISKRKLSNHKTLSISKPQNARPSRMMCSKRWVTLGYELEVYLACLLFCLSAEGATIFEKWLFQDYIETKTNADGSDLALHLNDLFYALNQPCGKRLTNLDESIAALPYVNGKLFAEPPPAQFDRKCVKPYSIYARWIGALSPLLYSAVCFKALWMLMRGVTWAHLHQPFDKLRGK